jgi:hypothetical protein
MITQILGVALISLLTITPTIQQNNIEQLIAPNIEIQQNILAGATNNYYYYLYNVDYIDYNGNFYTGDAGDNNNFRIINETAYMSGVTSVGMTGTNVKNGLKNWFEYYNGAMINQTVSFTETGNPISNNNLYYTFTMSNNLSTKTGRLYVKTTSLVDDNTGSLTNTSITIPYSNNINVQQVVSQVNPVHNLENSTTHNNYIIAYHIGNYTRTFYQYDSINQNQGSYNYRLWGMTNYGFMVNLGIFSLNVGAPDTILPTITGITGNPTNWTNQPVTITVNATDNVGLNATAYSFDGGQTWQQSNQLTTSIMQVLEIRVRDTSGNIASQQVTINRIDTNDPAILLAGNWKNTFELGELANNESLLGYLSISDNLSGLNTGLTTISNFNYNQAGSYSNIQVSATDNAGNTNVFTLPTVNITQPADTTGPIITGPTIVNVVEGNILTQEILDLYSVSDISGIEPNTISIRDLDNNVITNWSQYTVGSYQLRVYARDTLNNITQYQFTLQVGEAPPPDLTAPTIVGPLLVSFEIGTYTSNTEILNLYTFIDNVAILQNQLIGEIDYSELGDYPVTIRSTDTSNNVTNRNVVVRIRDEVVLGNYNPLTDLLSGIFGGALSMIFTIGTINVLGLRLLDAMGVIILGAVLLFVYKAIKGGS